MGRTAQMASAVSTLPQPTVRPSVRPSAGPACFFKEMKTIGQRLDIVVEWNQSPARLFVCLIFRLSTSGEYRIPLKVSRTTTEDSIGEKIKYKYDSDPSDTTRSREGKLFGPCALRIRQKKGVARRRERGHRPAIYPVWV